MNRSVLKVIYLATALIFLAGLIFMVVYIRISSRPVSETSYLSSVVITKKEKEESGELFITLYSSDPLYEADEYFRWPKKVRLSDRAYYDVIIPGAVYDSLTLSTVVPLKEALEEDLLDTGKTAGNDKQGRHLSLEKIFTKEQYLKTYCTATCLSYDRTGTEYLSPASSILH